MRLDSLRQTIRKSSSTCRDLISVCSSTDEKVGDMAKSTYEDFRATTREILQGENLPRYLRQYRFALRSTLGRLATLISTLQRYCISIRYKVIGCIFGKKFKVFEKIFDFKPQIKMICSQIKSACRRYIRKASNALNKLR